MNISVLERLILLSDVCAHFLVPALELREYSDLLPINHLVYENFALRLSKLSWLFEPTELLVFANVKHLQLPLVVPSLDILKQLKKLKRLTMKLPSYRCRYSFETDYPYKPISFDWWQHDLSNLLLQELEIHYRLSKDQFLKLPKSLTLLCANFEKGTYDMTKFVQLVTFETHSRIVCLGLETLVHLETLVAPLISKFPPSLKSLETSDQIDFLEIPMSLERLVLSNVSSNFCTLPNVTFFCCKSSFPNDTFTKMLHCLPNLKELYGEFGLITNEVELPKLVKTNCRVQNDRVRQRLETYEYSSFYDADLSQLVNLTEVTIIPCDSRLLSLQHFKRLKKVCIKGKVSDPMTYFQHFPTTIEELVLTEEISLKGNWLARFPNLQRLTGFYLFVFQNEIPNGVFVVCLALHNTIRGRVHSTYMNQVIEQDGHWCFDKELEMYINCHTSAPQDEE